MDEAVIKAHVILTLMQRTEVMCPYSLQRILLACGLVSAYAAFGAEPEPSSDWPQFRGPNRDGIAVNSPKLLDAWPKEGPPLLWKSGLVPSYRDGGLGAPVVADGKVFVYSNKLPVAGGDTFKFVTAELLADWGWCPDVPADLAKKVEEAWASKDRPVTDWRWWDPDKSKKADLDALLAKKPELDKYIKDFIATLSPENAKKYGDFIQRRLCIDTPKRKFGVPDGLSWEQLEKMNKLRDVGHKSCVEWVAALKDVGGFGLSHHITFSSNFYAAWTRAFTWSDAMICLEAATGKELWRKVFPVDPAVLKDPGVQWWVFDALGACATPAVWGGKCYMVGSMGLYCLSVKDGSLLWQVKGGPEHASPLIADGIVYHIGCAYDAETGKLLWKNSAWVIGDGKHIRDESGARYSSPLLWTSGGEKYVITSNGREAYVCLSLKTGEVKWTLKGEINSSPTVHDGTLIEASTNGRAAAFKMLPAGTELLWKASLGLSDSVVYLDHLYSPGICVDFRTGNENWKLRGREIFNAQILADGKIFGFNNSVSAESVPFGMYKATPEKYAELGSFNPQASIMCYPAFADGKIYTRLLDGIACYDLREHGVYLEGVTAAKDALTFRFKQTGGGLSVKDAAGLKINDAAGAEKPAQATIAGDTIVVDIRGAAAPFNISCTGGALAAKSGLAVPAFEWNEARLLKCKKCFDNTLVLTGNLPLPQVGNWDKPGTYSIDGAKVTAAVLDPSGKSVSLTTDRKWKIGEAISITYPCFAVDAGDVRIEKLTATVAEVQRAAAKFVKVDEATSGNWKGVYGAEGAVIAGEPDTAAPKGAIVAVRGKSDETPWAVNAADPRYLQKVGGAQGRAVKHWVSFDQMFIDIDVTDGKEHQVALYISFCSFEGMQVEVQDADTKAVLDTQEVNRADSTSRYLIWNVKGSVILRLSSKNGPHWHSIFAKASGVFFDSPTTVTK
ncbi:MAG: PQQ-like beta-propeller repeat protein [Planctomycetes bacterium]|nr:PQQ-like beta-propeller repeat protein [Planctomycetota bacterium]